MPDPLCTDAFGNAPRRFSILSRFGYLRVQKPAWLVQRPQDAINVIFAQMNVLFAQGTVVWGHVIQANQQMFKPGKHDCPGELVYSLPDRDRVSPAYLRALAGRLYSLKGTKPDHPALVGIADYLADEKIRVFGLAVPQTISPSFRCQISTTLFARKHLPDGRLCASLLPIIVLPHEPYVAMPLPAKFWPKEFLQQWISGKIG